MKEHMSRKVTKINVSTLLRKFLIKENL